MLQTMARLDLDSGFDKEGKARAWLNANTDLAERMVDDDTSFLWSNKVLMKLQKLTKHMI